MSLVYIEGLTHANGGKKLYENATLRINKGEHIALVGANGVGKTTLLNIINNSIVPDHGNIEVHPRVTVGYLDQHQKVDGEQTVNAYLEGAYKELFDIEAQIAKIYEDMAVEYKEDELVRALKLQEHLDLNDFEIIGKKIRSLVDGLGIEHERLEQKMGSLSGGQRGKVLLAKLLLSENDYLLLDEPTNFLDIEQVDWLAKFLQTFEPAFIMVSHDSDFINKTCNIIYEIENLKINRYVGNFDKYIEQSELRKEQYTKEYMGQQKTIKKLETYVAKNAARASTAKSAQSRQKQLDKMDVMKELNQQAKPHFSFKYKRPASAVIVKATDLEIGYDFPLIHPLNFELREGEKCIVSGYNGIGKTTFLKTLANEIPAVNGTCELGNGVQVAYFRQVEKNTDLTPVQYLKNLHEDMTESVIRGTIAKFGLKSALMNNPMSLLSGGEQTKVRLAEASLVPCSLLILDEPTNHIDVLAKEALLESIQKFEGTVLLTTHDINFSTKWADKILDFEKLI
ncbi:ABC-F family ATP-binding cassette domain-containing protein [Spiroplasma alleghenense]|uniref:ABC transporter ATP-binding protein n=1 Tax=Spiroplasma alleghenense TaxID=216931 RepID=A0A345Z2R3_9MOLU|nr:ABC-F family ATP-binding cassette domain-containing protein [Spiroplasma alleghenense]AXK50892.1 ABC transporter ATP-binding protein [Spiroplasma alleghenense]